MGLPIIGNILRQGDIAVDVAAAAVGRKQLLG